jgi:hypothetical protein
MNCCLIAPDSTTSKRNFQTPISLYTESSLFITLAVVKNIENVAVKKISDSEKKHFFGMMQDENFDGYRTHPRYQTGN